MKCYECARQGIDTDAVALCKFCMAGLCLEYLYQDYKDYKVAPKLSCTHTVPPKRSAATRSVSARAKPNSA